MKKHYIKLGVNETNEYTLLVRVDTDTLSISPSDPAPYIVAWRYNSEKQNWCQGHYFDDFYKALEFMYASDED